MENNERGLGKKLLVGAGIGLAAVGAVAVIGGVYHYNKKQKKKRKVKYNGKTRKVYCDTLIDDRGVELPGQMFNHEGFCINEQEVLSRAVDSGLINVATSSCGGCDTQPNNYYNQPGNYYTQEGNYHNQQNNYYTQPNNYNNQVSNYPTQPNYYEPGNYSGQPNNYYNQPDNYSNNQSSNLYNWN